MIAIFSTEAQAIVYADKIHNYLRANRPGYKAVRWALPERSADGLLWLVKAPPENDKQLWSIPINTVAELSVAVGKTIPLPKEGTVETGKYYLDKGDVVKCIKTTTINIDIKEDITVFTYIRGSLDTQKPKGWVDKFDYKIGNKVLFKDIVYVCLKDHTSTKELTPDVAKELWGLNK